MKWEEVERCLKKGNPELSSLTPARYFRASEKMGDLFAPVLNLRQTLPAVEELRKLSVAINAVRPGPTSKAGGKRSSAADERRESRL